MNDSKRKLLDADGQPALWCIRGRVQAEDGKAVPNASLRLFAPITQRLETDAEGDFEVSIVPPERPIRLILSARAGSMIGVHWQRLEAGSQDLVCVNVTAAAWGPIKALLFSKLAWMLVTRVLLRPRVLLSSFVVLVVLLWVLVDPLAREVPWISSFMRTNNLLVVSHYRNASIETDVFPSLVRDYQRVILEQVDDQDPIVLNHLCTVERGGSLEIRGPLTINVQNEGGILARGVLSVEGQTGQPVRFERADDQKRGGFIEVVGAGAAGTILSHVEFVGGRGATYWIPRIYESSTPAHYQQPRLRRDRPGINGADDDDGVVNRQVGGALFLYDANDITVSQTVFLENRAELGPATK